MTTHLCELDHAASRLVSSPAFRCGATTIDFSDYVRPLHLGRQVDVDPIGVLLRELYDRYSSEGQTTEADAWLAPRLHYALRLTRREAAVQGLWNWLGCVAFPDFVRWRWGTPVDPASEPDSGAAQLDRFIGPLYKQAFARLWWMAELFRDGNEYTPVQAALMNQDIPNNLFRMDIAHHRPTVQAAVLVLADKGGREANALAKAINAAATTLPVDVVAPDETPDADAMRVWVEGAGDVDPTAYFDTLPPGPDEGRTPAASVSSMRSLLEELLAEAPIRGRAS